ncbi:DC1 domain-containing protein [archaeon]|nr:DC1 domain-containing protein [archaeon]
MDFCKVCGMPLDGKVSVYVCSSCNSKVDGSCARKRDNLVICDSCVKKKNDLVQRVQKREELRWQQRKEERQGIE